MDHRIPYADMTPEEKYAAALQRGVSSKDCVGKKVHAGHHKRELYWTYWYRTDKGEPWPQICGARIKFSKGERRCSQLSRYLFKNGRCKMHGGRNPGGPPKHGRHSMLRGPLAEALSRVEEDKSLLDLRSGIAVMDIRLEDLSSRMEQADSPRWRKRVQNALKKFVEAYKDDDKEEAEFRLTVLQELVDGGCDIDDAWNDLTKANKERATRAEKAADLALRSETILRPQQVQAFCYRVIDVLSQELTEASFQRVSSRLVEDVLDGRFARLREAEAGGTGPLLSGVSREGAKVRSGYSGGEAVEVSAHVDRAAVHEREGVSEDEPRSGEDALGGDGGPIIPVYPRGRGHHHDGADGASGEEPAVGGDREDARESEVAPPRDAGHDAAEDRT